MLLLYQLEGCMYNPPPTPTPKEEKSHPADYKECSSLRITYIPSAAIIRNRYSSSRRHCPSNRYPPVSQTPPPKIRSANSKGHCCSLGVGISSYHFCQAQLSS